MTGCRSAAGRLDTFFTTLHEQGLFDGAVVIGKGERIVWEKGFGLADAERGVAFTPDTPADGASLAKTFTAALLLALESEGRLRLDDPAQRWLPELPYPAITLRHLVSHSSGLLSDYAYFDPFLGKDEVRTTEKLLNVIAAQKPALAFEPGSAFEYSSFAYDLAALAAARAGGSTYGELLAARYFRPLGMTSAFLRPGRFADFPGIRTRAYRRKGAARDPHDVFDLEAFHGGSNIYLSARDLHRWNASFFGAPPAARATIAGHRSGLDLGSWYPSTGGLSFWYSGHLEGFHDEAFRDTSTRTSIVYVSNNTLAPWLQKAIVRDVRRLLAGEDVEVPREPAVDEVSSVPQGAWILPHRGPITIEDSHLVRDGVRYRMFPADGRWFYAPGVDLMVAFAGDRIYVASNVGEEWGERVIAAPSASSIQSAGR